MRYEVGGGRCEVGGMRFEVGGWAATLTPWSHALPPSSLSASQQPPEDLLSPARELLRRISGGAQAKRGVGVMRNERRETRCRQQTVMNVNIDEISICQYFHIQQTLGRCLSSTSAFSGFRIRLDKLMEIVLRVYANQFRLGICSGEAEGIGYLFGGVPFDLKGTESSIFQLNQIYLLLTGGAPEIVFKAGPPLVQIFLQDALNSSFDHAYLRIMFLEGEEYVKRNMCFWGVQSLKLAIFGDCTPQNG